MLHSTKQGRDVALCALGTLEQQGLKLKAFLFDLQLTRKFTWLSLPIPQQSGLIVLDTFS